ncbi:MAG: hypothetical protein U0L17_08215 [Acutalibacteraceae bacterium]|nr:hypothetical protein [Acutalibacteraceae bacterium]
MKAKKQFSIKKLLACVLSLAVIFSAFVFTSVSADTEKVILDWSNWNGFSGGGFDKTPDDPTGYVHVTGSKTLSDQTQSIDLVNWWNWTADGYDKVKFTAYTASGSCDINMTFDGKTTANTTISTEPTVITYDVPAITKMGDVKFTLDAGSKGATVDVDLYIGDVYGVVVSKEPEYSVTIDGENKGNFSSYTFPESSAAGFIAYTDGTNYYAAGDTVIITEAKDFTTVAYGALKMEEGASIRLGAVNGMRFYTPINAAKIAELTGMGATVELGTLIAPKDLVGEGLTFDLPKANYADVPFTSKTYFTETGFKGVVGSIVGIKPTNTTREFVGRGYIKVTLGGVSATIYADYAGSDIANNARSIAAIAKAYQGSEEYATKDADLKAIVDAWAAEYVASNSINGIDVSTVEAVGKGILNADLENQVFQIGMDQWDGDLTVGACVKFNVNGLTEGSITAYQGAGTGWDGTEKGAHYGVEIDGVVYWDGVYDSGEIKGKESKTYTFTGKNMYSLKDNSLSGSGKYDVERRITADDLANITAVYIRPGNHYNAQWVYVTNVK